MKAGSELLFFSLVGTLKLCTSPQLIVLEVEFGFSDKPKPFSCGSNLGISLLAAFLWGEGISTAHRALAPSLSPSPPRSSVTLIQARPARHVLLPLTSNFRVPYAFKADLLEGLKHHHGGHGDHRENQHHGAIEPRWSNGDGMANRFTCKGRPPGYYADMQLDCQVTICT